MSERIRIEWTQENADKLATELRELVAERDRYRAALERIADLPNGLSHTGRDIALAALDPTEAPRST